MAILLAISFELGAIASALSITVLDKVSKFAVWSMFIILTIFQMIGNAYYTFNYVINSEILNTNYLDIISKFLQYFWEFESTDDIKMFLSILIGIPIPLISLAFLKTLVDYISNSEKEKIEVLEVEKVEEEPLYIEEIEEKEDVKKIENVEEEIVEQEELQEDTNKIEEEIKIDINKDIESVEVNKEEEEVSETKTENESEEIENFSNIPYLNKKRNESDLEKENRKMKDELIKLYPQIYGKKFQEPLK
jgi:hypothetical protein